MCSVDVSLVVIKSLINLTHGDLFYFNNFMWISISSLSYAIIV